MVMPAMMSFLGKMAMIHLLAVETMTPFMAVTGMTSISSTRAMEQTGCMNTEAMILFGSVLELLLATYNS